MTTNDNTYEDVADILAASDANGETAAPDDLDTAGPADDDEDTAGAELAAEEGDTGDVRALKRRGRHSVTLEELRRMQARSRARGVAVGKRRAQQQPQQAKPQLPRNMIPPDEGVRKLVQRWSSQDKRFRTRQDGHYYSTCEIVCTVTGNPKSSCCVRIPKGQYKFFDRAMGDDMTFLGVHPSKVTANWTNFQRPSKTAYIEQDFLIRSVSMQEAGMRIRYEQSDISNAQDIDAHVDVVTGKTWIWDDMGAFLPKEIFQDFNGENLLYRALRRGAVLFFNWDKRRSGHGTTRMVLIDHLRNVPDAKAKSLARTSGGAPVLSVSDGYIFTDNPEQSDEGAFTAVIVVEEDIVFPIKPIDIGTGMPSKPAQIGLYVQLSLNGISFEHEDRNRA